MAIKKTCAKAVARVHESPEEKNPKGQLQEILQAIAKEGPMYEVVDESGPDHLKHYNVLAKWKGVLLGEGVGASKKEAEIKAASDALQKTLWEDYTI